MCVCVWGGGLVSGKRLCLNLAVRSKCEICYHSDESSKGVCDVTKCAGWLGSGDRVRVDPLMETLLMSATEKQNLHCITLL